MIVRKNSPKTKYLTRSLWMTIALTLILSLLASAPLHNSSRAASAPPQQEQATPSTLVTFTNSTPITINTIGTASLYPSSITVSGLTGNISTIPGSFRVTIRGLSHAHMDNVGMVLVGPTGAAFAFQNGGSFGVNMSMVNLTYTISDHGLIRLPSNNAWGNGTYKPTNLYDGDNFPSPGPGTNYANPGPDNGGTATFASVYGGTDPNGVWNLFIYDFVNGSSGQISGGWSLTIDTNPPPVYRRVVLDFDGDGKTDYPVTRDTGGLRSWYTEQSTAGFSAASWGSAGDLNVPGDYDGDGKWDIAIWRAGIFYILRSLDGTVKTVRLGNAGDNPLVSQDFDGDGTTDPIVTFNAVGGLLGWLIQRSTFGWTAVHFGTAATDVGIRGDFDGDGFADLAVYRNGSGTPANTFIIRSTSDGSIQYVTFGDSSLDKIVPADFDGDGKTDCAVWRESTGTWYWLNSSNGAFNAYNFGIGNLDLPTPGDFDGDGKTDHAVWRPTDGTFYVNRSTNGFHAFQFGATGDSPVGHFLQVR